MFRWLGAPGVFIRHPVIIVWRTPVWIWLSPFGFRLTPRLVGLTGAPTSDPCGRRLRMDGRRFLWRLWRRPLLGLLWWLLLRRTVPSWLGLRLRRLRRLLVWLLR